MVQVSPSGGSVAGSLNYTDTGCTTTRLGQAGVRVHNATASFRNVSAASVPWNEAENATLNHVIVYGSTSASNGAYVGGIDYSDSSVGFKNVWAPVAGTYTLRIIYANGSGSVSSHNLSVNGGSPVSVQYPTTAGWGQFGKVSFDVSLNAGDNSLTFTKGTLWAELDALSVSTRYEAENAATNHIIKYTSSSASNGAYVGGINYSDSSVSFTTVSVPQAGTYTIQIRYANGGATSSHNLSVNGGTPGSVSYSPTSGWGQFAYTTASVTLAAGLNTLTFTKGTNYAELDSIDVTL
jgi:hypothetical protein